MPPKPKLTDEQIADIRARKAADPSITLGTFAKEFGVNESTISRVWATKEEALATAAPTAAEPGSTLATAVHAAIHRNPKNPRRLFDQDAIDEMAASIAEKGILSPLLVRPHPTIAGTFELIAGERRWRGAALAIERGTVGADLRIPIIIRSCDDREALELAMMENLQRQDMTPIEEAEGYQAMVDMGDTPADIERKLGVNRRTVQKRLRLIKDLTLQVREGLAVGDVSVEFANVLAAYCPKSQQNATLEEIKQGRIATTAILKRMILSTRISEKAALFDVAEYNGAWIEDEENPGQRYFADGAEFKKLQAKALKAKQAELEQTYSLVEVFDRSKGQYFHDWQYKEDPTHPKARAIIVIDDRGGATIHLGLVHESDQRKPTSAKATTGTDSPADPMAEFTKAHLAACRQAKTKLLQAAVADNFKAALALSLVGLLYGNGVHLKIVSHESEDRAGNQAILHRLEETADRFGDLLEFGESSDGTAAYGYGPLRIKGHSHWNRDLAKEEKLFRVLMALPDDDLHGIFSAIVAERVGSWNGFETGFGDDPLPAAIAEDLAVDPAKSWAMDDDWLKKLRKNALHRIARDLGLAKGWEGLSSAKLREEILTAASEAEGYVPPMMTFGEPKKVEAATRDWITGKAPIKVNKQAPLLKWSTVQRLAGIVEQIAQDDNFPSSVADVRKALVAGVNAIQGADFDLDVSDDATFEILNIDASELIDELFEICWPAAKYVGIKTLGNAVAFVCGALGFEHTTPTAGAAE